MSPLVHAVLLTLHIGGGSLAILTGAGAATVRKGERLHQLFGTAFVVAMLTMATAATTLAIILGQTTNILAGFFAFYLVLSGWMTVKRREGTIGRYERFALIVPLGASAIDFGLGMVASASPHGLGGYAPIFYYVSATVIGFAGLLDLSVVMRGGVFGVQRIARHLWRMCFAFFIAAGSFFLGQQKVMPVAWHGSRILLVLGLAPLAVMAFWLIRVRIGNRFKLQAAAT